MAKRFRHVVVTGGAGYIGSVVTERLIARGHRVTVFDSLTLGHRKAVHPDADFVRVDIREAEALRSALEHAVLEHGADSVIHLAALSQVGHSMAMADSYYEVNLSGGVNLLKAMRWAGLKDIIFSSTAATYGIPDAQLITEDMAGAPINPYGESKWAFERMLHWHGVAHGLRHVSLRYFNAAGATVERGEDHFPETHLIPLAIQAASGRRDQLVVFGDDYDTPDGTCVRDYVHVEDLAEAHVDVLEQLDTVSGQAFNVGIGRGYSIREVLNAVEEVCGVPVPHVIGDRRTGDPPQLVACSDALRRAVGWQPKHEGIVGIVRSAWDWMERHPSGYRTEAGD